MSVASAILLNNNSIDPADKAYEDISRSVGQTRSLEYGNGATNLNANTSNFSTSVNLADFTDILDPDYSLWYEGMLVNFTGRIKVTANAHIESFGTRPAVQMRLLHYGDEYGPISSTGYIRDSNGHTQSSLHSSHILDVHSGGAVLFYSRRQPGSAVGADVRFAEEKTSSLTIQRIS